VNGYLLALLVASLARDCSGQAISATCTVARGSGAGIVAGIINLSQSPNSNVTVKISLTGLDPAGSKEHGFHVHAVSALTNLCVDAGPHLNLDSTLHGAPYDPEDMRHTGDLGNIEMDANGNVNMVINDWLISLSGPRSVIGKPIVIHELMDDLGCGNSSVSNTTGNAGARLGCCLIVADSSAYSVTTRNTWPIVALVSLLGSVFSI